MLRLPIRVPAGVVLLLLAQLLLPAAAIQPAAAQAGGTLFVYHQISNFPEGTGSVGYPVLSGDGSTAVYTNAPGTGDPATPNRIYTITSDGSGATEVNSYTPLCFCGSMADISADGGTVVSTDSVQVRIADGGGARELLVLNSNEITSLVITGDGRTVYFIVRRDAATSDGATQLPRGVWAIDAGGGNLRQVAGADDIAGALGLPIEQTGCCFHGDGRPLDASDDGSRIVFAAYAGTGEHIFSVDSSGGNLVALRNDLQYAMRVAISGDGSLAAYDGTPVGETLNEVAVLPPVGGVPHVLTTMPYSGYDEPFQLSKTGSQLLVSSNGLLFDTATGDATLLAASIYGVGGNHVAVLTDGLPRGTMDANAENFLYVMRSVPRAIARTTGATRGTRADPVTWAGAIHLECAYRPRVDRGELRVRTTVSAAIDANGNCSGRFVALSEARSIPMLAGICCCSMTAERGHCRGRWHLHGCRSGA